MSGFDEFMQSRDPRMKVRSVAASAGIPEDVADDFANVTGGIESGNSHYKANGKVKMSPVDPKDGQRAYGFSQIKPGTAAKYGFSAQDLLDESKNIEAGLREFYSVDQKDPVARRIGYFSGSGSRALKYYRRTGKIPQGGDFTGTSFQKYIDSTMPSSPPLVKSKAQSSGAFDAFMSTRASASNQPAEAPNQAPETALAQNAPQTLDTSLTRPRIAPYTTTPDGEVRQDEFAPVSNTYRIEQQKYNQADIVGAQAVEANRLNRIIARRAQRAARAQQAARDEEAKEARAMRNIEAQGAPRELPDNPTLADLSQQADTATSQNNQVTSMGELQRREGRLGQSRTRGIGEVRQADNNLIQARDELYKSIGGLRARDETEIQNRSALRDQIKQSLLNQKAQAAELGNRGVIDTSYSNSPLYGMSDKELDAEVEKRAREVEEQSARDAEIRKLFTPEERAAIQKNIGEEGQYGDIRRGATTGFHGIFLTTLDKLGAGAARLMAGLNIPGAKEAEEDYRKRELAFREQSQAVEEEHPLGWKGKTAKFVAGNVPNILPVAASSALTGNPIAGFALYNALVATGEGKAPSEVIREGVKGAATGAVFQAGGKLSLFPRVATVGLGTAVVEKAFGASDGETLGASVTNALFAALSGKDAIHKQLWAKLGARIRIWKNGSPIADVENTENGVRLLPPAPESSADANVEPTGKAGDGSLIYQPRLPAGFEAKQLKPAPNDGRYATYVPPAPSSAPAPDYRLERIGGKIVVQTPNGPDIQTFNDSVAGRRRAIERMRILADKAQPKIRDLGVAPTERQGEAVSVPVPQPPKPAPTVPEGQSSPLANVRTYGTAEANGTASTGDLTGGRIASGGNEHGTLYVELPNGKTTIVKQSELSPEQFEALGGQSAIDEIAAKREAAIAEGKARRETSKAEVGGVGEATKSDKLSAMSDQSPELMSGKEAEGQRETSDRLTNTPEFKKRFGASKAVDDSGNPQLFYRGEQYKWDYDPAKLADERTGLYLTTSHPHARLFGEDRPDAPPTALTRAFYVRVENPLIYDGEERAFQFWQEENLQDEDLDTSDRQAFLDFVSERGGSYGVLNDETYNFDELMHDLSASARSKGHDGVVVDFGDLPTTGGSDVPFGKMVIVFKPEQLIPADIDSSKQPTEGRTSAPLSTEQPKPSQAEEKPSESDYTISPARYSKGNFAVRTPSSTGYKTRAARLAGAINHDRRTNREQAYIMTPAQVRRFERLYKEGWDASSVTGKLQEPAGGAGEHHSNFQPRRQRSTKSGTKGQFKKGSPEPQSGKFDKFMESRQDVPLWQRMKESDTPLSDRQRDVEAERGKTIREQPTELTKADTAPAIRRAMDALLAKPKDTLTSLRALHEAGRISPREFRRRAANVESKPQEKLSSEEVSRRDRRRLKAAGLEPGQLNPSPQEVSEQKEKEREGDVFGSFPTRRGEAGFLTIPSLNTTGRTAAALNRNALLTLKGFERIAIGMTSKQVVDLVGDGIAGVIDAAISRTLNRPRTVGNLTPASLIRASIQGTKLAAKSIGEVARGKETFYAPEEEPVTGAPVVDAAINAMIRLYGSKEAAIRSYAYAKSIETQARMMAVNDRRAGLIRRSQVSDRAKLYRINPPPMVALNAAIASEMAAVQLEYEMKSHRFDAKAVATATGTTIANATNVRLRQLETDTKELMRSIALRFSDEQVYAEPSEISSKVAKATNALGATGRIVREIYLPFMKRPSNSIVDFLQTYVGAPLNIPVQGMKLLSDVVNGNFNAENQARFAKSVGRGMAGYALIGLGLALASLGILVGGKLLIGGEKYDIRKIPFGGWLLALGGALHDEGYKGVAASVAKSAIDHPLLGGLDRMGSDISDVSDAAKNKDWKPLERMAKRTGAALLSRAVPSPLAITAEATDDVKRDTSQSFFAPLMNRIPGEREKLPYGDDKSKFSFINPFEEDAYADKQGAKIEKRDKAEEIKQRARSGQLSKGELRRLVRSGEITPQQGSEIWNGRNDTESQDRFRKLELPEAEKKYLHSSAQEQFEWRKILKEKRERAKEMKESAKEFEP